LNVFKGTGFGEIKCYDGSNGSSIVSISNSSKSLLASGVPNLIFNSFALNIDSFSSELDADGRLGVHSERTVYETRQKVGFSDTGIANHHNLEEVVELLLFAHVLLMNNFINDMINIYFYNKSYISSMNRFAVYFARNSLSLLILSAISKCLLLRSALQS
jgi:hypothetical protein